jgi:hypothetical protein
VVAVNDGPGFVTGAMPYPRPADPLITDVKDLKTVAFTKPGRFLHV